MASRQIKPGQRAWILTPLHISARGRARARLPALVGANGLAARIAERLLETNGIRDVNVSADTGSILLFHDPDTPVEDVLQSAQAGLYDLAGVGEQSRPPAKTHAERTDTRRRSGRVRRQASTARMAAGEPTSRTGGSGEIEWHTVSVADCLAALGAEPNGLDAASIARRLAEHGLNALQEAGPTPAWKMVADQVVTAPVALLAGSAGIALLTGGLVDALAIATVVAINTVIGYGTERQSENVIRSLMVGAPERIPVIRDGRETMADLAEVVPGDILVLRPGTYIAADARLIAERGLFTDESALTGESMPVVKDALAQLKSDTPVADRRNMIFRGTLVTGGSGTAAVVATGGATELGRVQATAGEIATRATPMEQQLQQLGGQLAAASVAACLAVFGVGLLRRMPLVELLKSSVSLGVAAVPEGLPAVATTTLALGIKRMGQQRVAIRRLGAVEALGAIDVLCLDKTGTLTENRMTVTSVIISGDSFSLQDGVLTNGATNLADSADPDLNRLLRMLVLCNESTVEKRGDKIRIEGSPTESALVQVAIDAGLDVGAIRRRHPALETIHRSESRHYMLTLHRGVAGRRQLAVKGSPAEVLDRCRWIRRSGRRRPLRQRDRQAAIRENERLASLGMRVLGIAQANILPEVSPEEAGLEWLGLVAMADPIRPEMKSLISELHRAGIATVMITGDQPATARAVARQLDLSGGRPLKILDSTDLKGVDPELLGGLAQETHVFARVTPTHKLEIVQALQNRGRVVGMTGDGINDGPALKAADVGIAMGSGQQDVARSVSDVVIQDDELATVLHAVAQGRTIYSNIRKALHFLLSTNFSEIEVMLAALALGMPQPLSAMQLLWINLVTDIFPGLALAVEPAEPEVLSRPPRDPAEPILTAGHLRLMTGESAVITAGTLSAFTYGLARYGAGARAGTIAFNTLTCAQLLHAFSCRSDEHAAFGIGSKAENRWLTLAAGGALAAQASTLVFPPLRRLLGGTGVSLMDTAVIGAGAVGPLAVNEFLKRRRTEKGRSRQRDPGDPS